ncbi:hypothetical protein ACRJ4W_51695 [Streptomyces sp. GLT-R25]
MAAGLKHAARGLLHGRRRARSRDSDFRAVRLLGRRKVFRVRPDASGDPRQQTSHRPLTWGFIMERGTGPNSHPQLGK